MSLEDFSRMAQGKRPRDRSWLDRYVNSDEDGCSYDQAVFTGRIPLAFGLVVAGGLMLVGWVTNDPLWIEFLAKLQRLLDALKWLLTP